MKNPIGDNGLDRVIFMEGLGPAVISAKQMQKWAAEQRSVSQYSRGKKLGK